MDGVPVRSSEHGCSHGRGRSAAALKDREEGGGATLNRAGKVALLLGAHQFGGRGGCNEGRPRIFG